MVQNIVGMVVSGVVLIIGVYLFGEINDLITGTESWETLATTVIPITLVLGGSLGLLILGTRTALNPGRRM